MILDGLYLFENQTETGDSKIINNTKGTILVLQVKCDSTFGFDIQGSVDGINYNNLAAIDILSLSKVTSINSQGIYQADISGCKKIKLNASVIGSEGLTVHGIVKEG